MKFVAGQKVMAWDSHAHRHVPVVLLVWKPYRGIPGWDVGVPIRGWCDEQRMRLIPNDPSSPTAR